MRPNLVVLLFAFLFATAAAAEVFTPQGFGFSADFPGPVNHPAASEARGADGNVASRVDIFQTQKTGVWHAGVAVQIYTVPANAPIAEELAANRDSYLAQMHSSPTSSTSGKLGGYPALAFTFDNADHTISGRGIVVIVPVSLRRVYIAAFGRRPQASTNEVVALNRFLDTFRVSN